MASTSMTPVSRAIPSTNADISGSFTAAASRLRLSAVLTGSGGDRLSIIRRQATGYWQPTGVELSLSRGQSDFQGASDSVEIEASSGEKFHVVSETGFAVSSAVVYFEDLSAPSAVSLPAISGDTIALIAASQVLSNKTLSAPSSPPRRFSATRR